MPLTQVQSGLLESGAALNNIGAGNITPSFLSTQAQYTGFKNRIINGAMMIDQRNNGASVTSFSGSPKYVTDRWAGWANGAGNLTMQQSSVAPPGFKNSLLATVSTQDSSLDATDYYLISQAIEGLNVADLGWGTANAQPVALSFWVRASVTGIYSGCARNSAANYNYPFQFTISQANTWEYKTVTISAPTTGTWLTDNGVGIYLWFSLATGTTYTDTAGAWSTKAFVTGANGAINMMATNGATFYITGVQLEKGSTATSFDYRPYGTELQLARRYYWRVSATGSLPLLAFGAASTSTELHIVGNYPVEMRATPTYSGSSGQVQISTASGGTATVTSFAFVGTNQAYRAISLISSGSMTVNTHPYFLRALEPGGFIDFSAEL